MTLAAAIACVLPGRARADALVTLCQSDTQIGPGRNLDEALQDPSPPANNGAYRTITFACPGGAASITMTRQHTITQSTLIDGGGTVTLDGGGTSDMFTAHDPNLRLLFSNLVLRNARAPQSRCGGIFCLGGVVSGVLDLEILSHTRIESSTGPIAISGGNLRIADSTFAGNAVAAVSAGGRVPVSIERSTFQSNGYPLSEVTTVRIVDSNFSNNRLMDLSTCGQVMIDRTSFLNNTTDGALIVGCDTTITGSRFQGNSTAGNGGAVTVTGGARTVTVRSTQFLNNSANGDGGALHLDGSLTNAQTTLVLRHDTFDGNKARNGGAINQATTDKVVSVDATAVVLSHNMSGADGGAIALRGGELAAAGCVRYRQHGQRFRRSGRLQRARVHPRGWRQLQPTPLRECPVRAEHGGRRRRRVLRDLRDLRELYGNDRIPDLRWRFRPRCAQPASLWSALSTPWCRTARARAAARRIGPRSPHRRRP